MAAYATPVIVHQFFDDAGNPLSGGKVYTYDSGTTTPKTTYSDKAGTIPNSNPIILDSAGCCNLWLGTGEYTIREETSSGALVRTRDHVTGVDSIGNLAADLADTTSASKGGGLVGFNVLLSYAAGTVGAALKSLFSTVAALPWSNITGKPTTKSGYGITDMPAYSDLLATSNLLDNPAFSINQRGYVSGSATGSANQVTLDRWRVPTSGQSVPFAASGAGNTVTAPASGIEQIIRASNIRGGTYTVAWTGAGTCTINGVAATSGSQVTLPANTQVSVKFFGAVSEVMLVPGSSAGTFVMRSASEELRRCQVEYVQEAFYFARYGASAGAWAFSSMTLPVTMGATPTCGFIGSPAYGSCSSGAINVDGPRSLHMAASIGAATEFNMSGTFYASTGI